MFLESGINFDRQILVKNAKIAKFKCDIFSVRPNQDFYRTTEPNRTRFFLPNRTEPNLNRTIFIPEIIILLKNLLFLASALHAEDYFRSQKQHFAKL